MSETTRSVGDPGDTAAVRPTIGFVLAGFALAAMLAPVRRGVEDPVVWGAVGLAGIALATFFARRHGALARTIAGSIAAAASAGLLLLSGYALTQDVTGAVGLPVGGSVPLVFVAFLAAGGAIGAAVADYFAIPIDRLREQGATTALLSLVGIGTLLAMVFWMNLLVVPVFLLLGELTEVVETVISQVGTALGTATVAAAYLLLSDRDLSFIDVRTPTLRDLAWTLGGFVVLFGTLIAVSLLMTATGVESSSHGTTERAAENPEILLVLIPAAFLVIGPCEELLYRNVIQKSLYGVFSRAGAVVVGSVIFASVHVLAYATAGLGAVLASLGSIFVLSLVLGGIYERTGNVLVPAAIHGLFNAVQFALLYGEYG